MGKRIVVESHDHHHQQHSNNNHHHVTPVTTGARNIRKRKCNSNGNATEQHHANDKINNSKAKRMSSSSGHEWHENDDEDSSSNDGPPEVAQTPRNLSSKQANNSSILLNNSLNISLANEPNASLTESPKPVYTLRPSVVNGTVLYDLNEKPWRLGRPIGKGNFGEIFLASDNISIPVTNENAKFVVKIEPHSNGPLFVEIHCLMNTAKKEKYIKTEPKVEAHKSATTTTSAANPPILSEPPSGIPDYIASGSHFFGNARYRFLVLPRFDRDLHSLIKKCRVHQKSVLTLAIHIINVLENLHDKGYCHNDVKAQNLMISKCKYFAQSRKASPANENEATGYSTTTSNNGGKHIKSSSKYDDHYEEKQQTTDSGNSSEQEANDDDDEDFVVKRKVYNRVIDDTYHDGDDDDDEEEEEEDEDDDEDFDDGATTNSTNSNSLDNYRTPIHKKRTQKQKSSRSVVPYSGSNPVRSCRREKSNPMYDEMVSSHYLRPTKRVSYLEFFNEDNASSSNSVADDVQSISSDDESEEFVPPGSAKKSVGRSSNRRLTRRQEQLLAKNNKKLASIKRNKRHQEEEEENDKKKSIKAEATQEEDQQQRILVEDERIFLIDYGLASKFMDNGIHRPFVMDQRRAHDGTLEFTSRDAHMGAHSRRSDMECLGYNLLFWSQGYLPWKEAATNQQQEKVHRAKEYLMTDVREMLRQIYGKQVPKYLGEYLHLVGQLNYHERPDYSRYRRLFEREYEQLGYPLADMHLKMSEIQRTCVRVKEEIENKNDFFDMNRANGVFNMAYNVMHSAVGGTPFHERTLSNRVSPKNLRSKSDKKATKKNKFSWTEILSQDPDLIARERAEREFDREEELSDIQQDTVRRYQGKPTYAIRQVLHRMGCPVEQYEQQRDEEIKARLKDKIKQDREEQNDVEMEECDEADGGTGDTCEAMDVDDDVNESEEVETDATDNSEQVHTTNSRRQKVSSSRVRSSTSNKRTKVSAARKLVLKTPNGVASDTPGDKKTTRKKYASKVKMLSPSNSTPVTSIVSTAKTAKSTAKSTTKRGSAMTKSSRKTAITSAAVTAASAAGEVEQHEQSSNTKRERRTRRCLLKTEQVGLLDDDSNSNYTPEGYMWKAGNHTESVYTRNCKK
uniref:non-specific serine/threonine protein kinase n=1 Tax=Musca domestica TaxID=7370 RepID=T1PL63_MUSDO